MFPVLKTKINFSGCKMWWCQRLFITVQKYIFSSNFKHD